MVVRVGISRLMVVVWAQFSKGRVGCGLGGRGHVEDLLHLVPWYHLVLVCQLVDGDQLVAVGYLVLDVG